MRFWLPKSDRLLDVMSATEIIEQLKELPASEQARVAKFITESGGVSSANFSLGTEDDGLPVIRGQGGKITSEFIRELESLTM